jgi:murein DD-endopeptidase MepM/ murein hydrolase activator NlpD
MNPIEALLILNLFLPHSGVITQRYSQRHQAVDIACREGDEIRAAHEGTVKKSFNSRTGNVVEVRGNELISSYHHLSRTVSQKEVLQGEVIGWCGNTGGWSTGPHLHWELDRL